MVFIFRDSAVYIYIYIYVDYILCLSPYLKALHPAEIDGVEDGRPETFGVARGGHVQAQLVQQAQYSARLEKAPPFAAEVATTTAARGFNGTRWCGL